MMCQSRSLPLPGLRRPVHHGAARSVASDHQRARAIFRHGRHGHRHRHHALLADPPSSFGGLVLIVLGLAIGGGIGAYHRPLDPDDGDAAACRRLPFAGRSCRRACRSLGALYAGGFRHRRDRRDPHRRWSKCRSASPSAPSPLPARSSRFAKLDGRMSGADHAAGRHMSSTRFFSVSLVLFIILIDRACASRKAI